MHPLDHSLDENFHQPKFQRRRSSLDNSCLGAAQSSLLSFGSDDSEGTRRLRRLSLNNTTATIPTFLAELSVRPKSKDLDMDWHESVHSRTSMAASSTHNSPTAAAAAATTAGGGGVLRHSMASTNISFASSEGSESSMDDDSDGEDSFCDASAEEPANRIYLRKDLGASCFWSDDSMDEVDVQDAMHDQDHEKYHKDWPKPGDGREKLPAPRAPPRRRKRNGESSPIKKAIGRVVDKVMGVPN
jgi:hypothetical protein